MPVYLFFFIIFWSSLSYGWGSGIVDITSDIETDIFPKSWYSNRINVKATKISGNDKERSHRIILKALSKYPKNLIKNNLSKVYLVKELSFYGVKAGGTNSGDSIYIANKGIDKGYTDKYIEELFHAELSSILLRKNKGMFKASEWKKINIPGFNYGESGVEFIKKNRKGQTSDVEYLMLGFVNEYAMSTLENDFNSIAKNLFTSGDGFIVKTEDYDILQKKLDLAIDFYNKLDKGYTLQYFKKL